MKHFTTPAFWKLYGNLSNQIQKQSDKAFAHLKENPAHPSLHFKKVGNYWSARITQNHRALAIKSDDDFIWFWIGNHGDYERMIG